MKKLKNIIIVVDHGYISGGAAKVALSSLHGLSNRGFNIHLVYGVAPLELDLIDSEIICHYLALQELTNSTSISSSFFGGLWNPFAAARFGKVLQNFNSEDTIVHFHTWTKSFSASVIRKAWIKNFKIICTAHDFFITCPNGGFYNYNTMKACSLNPMSLSCFFSNCDSRSYAHKVWRFLRQLIQENFAGVPKKINHFITVSNYSEIILRNFLPPNVSISKISNPINVQKKFPVKPSEANLFTFVGRLSPEKGADLFAISANLAGVNACFVGEGEQLKLLKRICPNAIFLGWQDKAGVIKALQSSRALIFPSRWHETQGLVVAEAAALGVPSIVSDACAAIDYVENDKTGLIFLAGDIQDLANKINKLKENPLKADCLGAAAYAKYWNSPCLIDKHADDLIQRYKDVLNS